ncbi:MAG TPA: methyltransferase domain-containing protein [Gaiellaceae bacterium]|jgi:SAM-dependent methyltransferase|nr:methyltransferase domain-containing protein [Gaiellaceae bacterium]
MKQYSRAWFEGRKRRARESARVVLPLVAEIIEPASVVDLGCGTGSWLCAARETGIEDVLGLDTSAVDVSTLEIPRSRFIVHDLATQPNLGRRFDLALCLEVGEHLAPESADVLCDSLVALSPVVLFSAAVPGQGGTDHRNEQWPEYWAERFADRGYAAHDFLRDKVWRDNRVRYFYAQNMILYVRTSHADRFARLPPSEAGPPLPLVHPRLLAATQRLFPRPADVTVRGFAYFLGKLVTYPLERRARSGGRP